MKIADRIAEDVQTLDPAQMLLVYDLISSLKTRRQPDVAVDVPEVCRRVRTALAGCRGSMSDDVIALRDDKV